MDAKGSGKGSKYHYDLIDVNLLGFRQNEEISILEIVLGTNNCDTPSNMGKFKSPRASDKDWKKYFPRAFIVGCDIDSRILFREDRIKTYKLNQTSATSWGEFVKQIPDTKFDLIIDDGLHAPFPNLITVKHCLPILTDDGMLVIEDVMEESIPGWLLLRMVLDKKWELRVLGTNASNLVFISRR